MLREAFTTFTEPVRAAGYQTAYFLANPHSQKQFGFARGFQHYRYAGAEKPERQLDAVLSWLEKEAVSPFLLFIHVIDPHAPYTPAKENYQAVFGTLPKETFNKLPKKDIDIITEYRTFYGRQAKDGNTAKPPLRALSDAGFQFLTQLYDGEINYVDAQFARLIALLEQKKLFNRSLIAFFSDHGEEFLEHGHLNHGTSLFDEQIHVPLIVRPPGGLRQSTRVPFSVGLYDLAPTVAGVPGATLPSYVQAQPLLGPDGGLVVGEDRVVFSELDYYNPDYRKWDAAMMLGSYKVMSQHKGGMLAVFDQNVDAEEKNNLLRYGCGCSPSLKRLLNTFKNEREKHETARKSFGEAVWSTDIDQDTEEKLKALGYI